MKKIGWLCISICFLLFVTACGEGEDSPKKEGTPTQSVEKKETKTEEKNKETTEKKTKETQQDSSVQKNPAPEAEQVSVNVGLGDTLEAYTKAYGKNKGDKTMGRFQNDYLLPMFADGRAINITIQFESTNNPSRTMEEAKVVASSMIPKDATLIKEYTDGEDIDLPRKVVEYHSDTLAPMFPEWEPAGTFIVIFNYRDGSENDVFGITIGLGNNP